MKYLSQKPKFLYLLIAILVDLVFFGATDPTKVPSVLLAAGFILLVITFYLGFKLVAEGLSGPDKQTRNTRSIILIATIFVAFIVGMQSIGQLSVRDVLAVIPLAVLLFVYLSYYVNQI